ncbi:hypothetical protein [Escherichia coli]|uniref:hypothetical protein n=1 Tax=Escherichia coli TaxID=562 RepID=UPI000F5DAB95|nr:hypothetical protein [Escherichia coli]RRC45728.1 hypothetical protein EIA13_28185 [Escherichia coli]
MRTKYHFSGHNNPKEAWIAERDRLNDHAEYRNGYQVSRKNLIDEGVLNRSQLSVNGNPVLRELLAVAEKRWYGEQVETLESHREARKASEASSKLKSAEVSRLQRGLAQAQAELAQIKAEMATLKAENERLRSELGIQKVREEAVVATYGGLDAWD